MARKLVEVDRPVRRVEARRGAEWEPRTWPYRIPAVAQVLRRGLDVAQATILVGENGSGKSTLLEGIAEAYGLNPEGGSTGARFSTRRTESPLSDALQLVRGQGDVLGQLVQNQTL